MTINGYRYNDKLIHTATMLGFRELSLTFKINKGDHEEHNVKEEIEIHLDKKDVERLLSTLFKLYGEAFFGNDTPADWGDNDYMTDEMEVVKDFHSWRAL